jgi:hypothetical protein
MEADATVDLNDDHTGADFVFLDVDPKGQYAGIFDRLKTPVGGVLAVHDICLEQSPLDLYRRLSSDPQWEVFLFPRERGTLIARRVS